MTDECNLRQFSVQVEQKLAITFNDYADLHKWSVDNLEQFWLTAWQLFDVVGDTGGPPYVLHPEDMLAARFFPAARLNFAENLLAKPGSGDAIVYRDERGRTRRMSWRELRTNTARLSNHFRAIGIGPGDRISAILPNTPEAIVAVLAAAAVGATWSSCSPDFGVQGILDRFGQIEPRVLLAADSYIYGGKSHAVVDKVAEVVRGLPTIEHLIIVGCNDSADGAIAALARSLGNHPDLTIAAFTAIVSSGTACEPEFTRLSFDHPIYILFSSGTTGPPKCIVHRAGGILLKHLCEHRLHADIRPGDRLFYFTTLGWMMWNWLVSGLASGATLMLYDGNPATPDAATLWDFAEHEGITHFGTSAKYIDAIKKAGLAPARTHDLKALRSIMSTGSPLAPESFDYIYNDVKSDVHLASISGGTDICGCFVMGAPGLPVRRGEIQCAALGMDVDIFDETGTGVLETKGELVCRKPFPSMPAGFWNDPDGSRYRQAYFGRFANVWHHGDFAERLRHGAFVIHGRSDATLNPGGVRIGTAEIYRQVEQLSEVLESLAIGQEWQGDVRIVLFVVMRPGAKLDDALVERIRMAIRNGASPRHVPARVIAVNDLPRTKSGKITELTVRDIVHGRPVHNREALANPEALDQFRNLESLNR